MDVSNPKEIATSVQGTEALARHLGLSRWTVSRALNAQPGVSEATRKRILQAVQDLRFQADPAARGLRGTSTGAVGVCFQELESPILIRKIGALQAHLRQAGFRVQFELAGGDPEIERDVLAHFRASRVDGIVLIGSSLDPDSDLTGLPPILHVDPVSKKLVPKVCLDREAAMRQIVEHLYRLGHRRFGLVGITSEVPYGNERLRALRKVVRALGLTEDEALVTLQPAPDADPKLSYERGRAFLDDVRKFWQAGQITALIVLNDRMAIGLMGALREHQIEVPADLSIVGFDNLDVAGVWPPGLTSVDQSVDAQMQAAVEALRHCLGGGNSEDAIQIAPELVTRGSTAEADRGQAKSGSV
jgi:DNA-binding LacI/PurR family transcriptional regulator